MTFSRVRSQGTYLLGALSALAAVGCHKLDGFDTKPGDAYCGTIIAAPPVFQDGFLSEGQPPNLALALTIDTGKLSSEPGILRSNDTLTGLCSSASQPLFRDAPLRAIPEVDHDVLSTLTFGEGHEHDFFAWVDSTCQGTLLSLVSLMKNDQVELRLFKPAHLPPENAAPADRPGFAVFHLQVQKGGCGF
jgi:hypothetical protein